MRSQPRFSISQWCYGLVIHGLGVVIHLVRGWYTPTGFSLFRLRKQKRCKTNEEGGFSRRSAPCHFCPSRRPIGGEGALTRYAPSRRDLFLRKSLSSVEANVDGPDGPDGTLPTGSR